MTDRPRKAASNGPAKILLVDDHPIVRQGITELIEYEEGLSVCCAAETVSEAMQAIAELKPDLAVVDLSLQDSSGLELIKEIKVQLVFRALKATPATRERKAFKAHRESRALKVIPVMQVSRVYKALKAILACRVFKALPVTHTGK